VSLLTVRLMMRGGGEKEEWFASRGWMLWRTPKEHPLEKKKRLWCVGGFFGGGGCRFVFLQVGLYEKRTKWGWGTEGRCTKNHSEEEEEVQRKENYRCG